MESKKLGIIQQVVITPKSLSIHGKKITTSV